MSQQSGNKASKGGWLTVFNRAFVKIRLSKFFYVFFVLLAISPIIYSIGLGNINRLFLSTESFEGYLISLFLSLFICLGVYYKHSIGKVEKEKELVSKSCEDLKRILDSTTDGLIAIDFNYNIIRANDAFNEIINKNKAITKAEDVKCFQLFKDYEMVGLEGGGDYCSTPNCPLKRIEKGEKRVEFEICGKDNKGSEIYLLLTATPLKDEEGTIIGVIETFKDIKKYKEIEKALKESEENYRVMVEDINEIVYSVDLNGIITYVSPVVKSVAGYDPSEVLGRSFIEFVHINDRKMIENAFAEYISTPGKQYPVEFRILAKKGEYIWVKTFSRPIIENSQVNGIRGTLSDITMQKEMEYKLKESESKYKTLVENANEAVIVVKNGVIVFSNSISSEITKFDRKELVDKPFIELIHPDDKESVLEFHQKRFEGVEVPVLLFFKIKANDGDTKWIKAKGVLAEWGGEDATIYFMSDITEIESSREKLKISARRWQTTFDAINDAVCILDPYGGIILCNKAMESMLDKRLGQIIGEKCWKAIYGMNTPSENCPITTAKETRKRESVVLQLSDRWFKASVDPIFDLEGEIQGFVHIISDITGQKQVEEEIFKLNQLQESIIDNADIWLNVLDSEGNVIIWNKAAENISGYSREEVVGEKEIWDWLYPEGSAVLYPAGNSEFGGSNTSSGFELSELEFESEITCKYGEKRTISWNCRELHDEDGVEIGHIILGKDITDRKRYEEALRESELKYRTTFERTGTAMMILEEDTIISHINDEFTELTGFGKNEVENKLSFMEFVHPFDINKMKNYHYGLRKGKEVPKKYNFRLIDKSGNMKFVMVAVDLIPGTQRSVASLIDFSKFKRLNNLLRVLSDINEFVAKSKNPKSVLKAVTQKLNVLYGAVFTALGESVESLTPIESKGLTFTSVEDYIKKSPSIINAMKGQIVQMDSKVCQDYIVESYKNVISLPLKHEKKNWGIISIHSDFAFIEEEIKLLEKICSNIAFAISAYHIEEDRRHAIEQLAVNLSQFNDSADRLRNPLAVLMASLEVKEHYDKEKLIKLVDVQTRKIKQALDEMRIEENKTYKLIQKGESE